ncbi:MAG: CPBP family intramembrane glutamic endopeptidase [Spirochaetota bacterium]|nr:CPBP family intramembrane glutamic endopeptidase [Spirochaetota bacterium]
MKQYLLVVLTAGNPDRISRGRWPRFFIILPTATLFTLVHIPVPVLMIAKFFMGGFITTLFLRYRDIWGPGLFHGIFAMAIPSSVLSENLLENVKEKKKQVQVEVHKNQEQG